MNDEITLNGVVYRRVTPATANGTARAKSRKPMNGLERFMTDHAGVVSVNELAAFIGVDEQQVRRWARNNDVRRVGATFVFGLETASKLTDDPWIMNLSGNGLAE